MKLEIVHVDFTDNVDWLVKLIDTNHNFYFIMESEFYKKLKLSIPVTKRELDFCDKGLQIEAFVQMIDNKAVVISIDHEINLQNYF